MDDVKLPLHVLNRFERRCAARFAQTPRRSRSLASRDDPFRSPQAAAGRISEAADAG